MTTPLKYYSPVTDVTFRKVFGEHIDLATSLLNAFLPLEEGRTITSIHFVPPELMPETPTRKNSIVDVRCEDSLGSTFLVEMQLNWDTDFFQRVVFNTSKAYVRQLDKGKPFRLLQPVYSLNFVQGDLHRGLPDWYHPYQLVHIYHSDRVFDGLKIVFAEMDKYRQLPAKGDGKRELWMRFFTEMTEKTRVPAPELLADPDISKAIGLLEAVNYEEWEQELYERYWDAVSVEATWKCIGQEEGERIGEERGLEEGLRQGLQQGLQQGVQQGREEERRNLVRSLSANGFDMASIARVTGLSREEIGRFFPRERT